MISSRKLPDAMRETSRRIAAFRIRLQSLD
jgi:hypothetical protein